MADLPLALWPCAQRTSQWQRHGRFVPESNRHPAKMLPEIARRVIAAYSDPGDLVLDPMCGIATTLVEAIHQERCAIGVELEGRWASLAAQNIAHARGQGAAAKALILQDDARYLGRGVLDEFAGQVPLILTSPPYGNATLGDPRGGKGMARSRVFEGRRMTAADRARAAKAPNWCRYGDSTGSVARLRYGTTEEALTAGTRSGESYLAAMAAIYTACARMLSPGGYLVLVTKNLRADGALRNIAGDTITLCQQIGLVFQQHIVALLAALRDGELLPRPSYFQLTHVRQARARGERTHLVCHEDVLVFQRPTRKKG
ncbi:MAG: DNA methyltransferase [Solirubrobacteraceae bacterium]